MKVLLGLSEMTISRLCKIQATKRKIEHMPNITVIGNASTYTEKIYNSQNTYTYTGTEVGWGGKRKGLNVYPRK